MFILICCILFALPERRNISDKIQECNSFGIIIESYLIINAISIVSSGFAVYHLFYYLFKYNEEDEIIDNLPEL